MGGIHYDAHALGLQHLVDGVGDLGRQLLLDLQAMAIDLQHPGELGNADHPPARQIGDMGAPDDGHHVMLAMGFEADVAQHHHLVIAVGFLEGALQEGDRIDFVSGEELLIGACHPPRGAEQALAIGVVAGPADQRAHRLERLLARRAADLYRLTGGDLLDVGFHRGLVGEGLAVLGMGHGRGDVSNDRPRHHVGRHVLPGRSNL